MTEAECLAIGGHGYVESNIVIATYPERYQRACKHCGHVQFGVRQPQTDWQDVADAAAAR